MGTDVAKVSLGSGIESETEDRQQTLCRRDLELDLSPGRASRDGKETVTSRDND